MEIIQGKKQKNVSLFTQLVAFPVLPHKQFRRLLRTCLALLVFSLAVHGYIFWRLYNHQIFFFNKSAVETLPSVNEAKLQSVLSDYQAKQAREIAASASTPLVLDPNK